MDRIADRHSRRGVLKLLGGVTVLAAVPTLALGPEDAAAGVAWCRADPHLRIGGRETNIYLERDANAANTSTGPIQLIVTVPVGVSTEILSSDAGFGYGYQISFQESASLNASANRVYIKLNAYVPGVDNQMQVRLVSDPLDPAYTPQTRRGTTNLWMSLNSQV